MKIHESGTIQTWIHIGKPTSLANMNSLFCFTISSVWICRNHPPKQTILEDKSSHQQGGKFRKEKLSCAAQLTTELVLLAIGTWNIFEINCRGDLSYYESIAEGPEWHQQSMDQNQWRINKLYVSIYLRYSNKTTSSNTVKEQQHSSNTTGKYKNSKCIIPLL